MPDKVASGGLSLFGKKARKRKKDKRESLLAKLKDYDPFKLLHESETPIGRRAKVRKGSYSDNVTYEFPADLDHPAKRMEIGFARVPGVTGFNCGNCRKFALGRFCTKYHINVQATDCCAGWEDKRKQIQEISQ